MTDPPRLLVAGAGKMARDIGAYFVTKGHRVDWVSRDGGRLAALQRRMQRTAARLDRAGARDATSRVGFHLLGDPTLATPDVVVEAVHETVSDKREIFDGLEPVCSPETILTTNSSSILPEDVRPGCLGVHFFYPVALTALVELIAPAGAAAAVEGVARARGWLEEAGFECIEQRGDSAFAANRLLLPCQVECLRALQRGLPPAAIDEASRAPLLPAGQLALMDAVGLDVVAAAVENYSTRMSSREVLDYAPLRDGLAELVAAGKRGAKNRDGLLMGSPLPWTAGRASEDGDVAAELVELGERLRWLLLHTCQRFVASGQLQAVDLDQICTALWQSETTIEQALSAGGAEALEQSMYRLYKATGASYFGPAHR